MRHAVIRGLCALVCALAFHAALVTGATYFGWLSSDDTTLPELDLTSVDLSFSETPDDSVTPAVQRPSPAVEAPSPTPQQPVIDTPPPPAVEFPPPPAVTPSPPPPPAVEFPPPEVTPPQPDVKQPPPPQAVEQAPPQPQDIKQPTPVAEPPSPPPSQPQQPPSVAVPPAPAPSQARVAVDKPPSPRRRIKPEYPKGARLRGEEGDVTLELDISARGMVEDVRVVSSCGFSELEQAAVQAVKRARFTPARRGSANVPGSARLTLTFRLKH